MRSAVMAQLRPAATLVVIALFAAAGWMIVSAQQDHAVPPLSRYEVSQKGRQFRPGVLTITRGDTIDILNDDGDLLHHAYITSPAFSFDSGDQKPGTTVAITFPVRGHFTVLCGIHPKMHLEVNVK